MNKDNTKTTILLIEDEESILELIRYNLTKAGYIVSGCPSGEVALDLVQEQAPDLIILDLMLPGISGLEVCKLLRSNSSSKEIPIIIVSARGEESDIVRGLELGADDYITKPFSPKILLARIKTVLRRRQTQIADNNSEITFGNFKIIPARFEVKISQLVISLTLTEFKVLHFLARHPGWVFTRYQIVDNVKGEDYAVTDRAVDVQIVGLRKKLGDYGKIIETVRGVGYRFREPITD